MIVDHGCSSGKRGYKTRGDAKLVKRRMIGAGRPDARGLSPYRCECGWFHLGHLHEDTKRGDVK